MPNHKKPRWLSLARIGLVSMAVLVEEIRLPFSSGVDAWLLGLWVLLFYGAIAIWISRNREALEQEPAPLDCVGQPITDMDVTRSDEFEGRQALPSSPARPRSLGQLETF